MGFGFASLRSHLLVSTLAAVALAASAAPASAEVRSASGTDPAGDSGGPLDLTAVEASYDDAGTISAKVSFASDPVAAEPGIVSVVFGVMSGDACDPGGSGSPAAALGGFTSPSVPSETPAIWVDSDGNEGAASRAFEGSAITFSATASPLAGKPFDCVGARLSSAAADLEWDRLDGVPRLAAPAPPEPPKPPLTQQQKLKRALAKCRKRFAGKRSRAAKRKLRRCRRQAKRRLGAGPVVERPGPTLAGATFTSFHYDPFFSDSWDAYSLIDSKWAYRGIPEGGVPRCTKVTAGTDEDGQPTDGCLRYSYDRKKKLIALDGRRAKVKTGKGGWRSFSFGEDEYHEAANLRPGSRFDAELESVYVFGIPPNQFTSFTWLATNRQGEFVKSSLAYGTTWDSNFSVVPPDQRGSYEVLPGKRLRLSFADGEVETMTAVIVPNTRTGSAVPAVDGLLLDDSLYIPDDN